MAGTLFVVATPIGNLEDITLRALRVLREVAVIAAEDTRRTAHLLARHAIATPTTSLHEHNERKKADALIARLRAGEDVAVVSDAGTPTISDPGGHLVRSAIEQGIRVVPVPGPSAVMAALSAAGASVGSFTFLGFPPIRAKDRALWFDRVVNAGTTVVFFEAPHRIRETLAELAALVGNRPVLVGRELTKAHEELVIAPINDVIGRLSSTRGEFTVVINSVESPQNRPIAVPTGSELAIELGHLTESAAIPRRRAINILAERYKLRPNQVYAAIEEAKNSGE